jgi:hypothetical protein
MPIYSGSIKINFWTIGKIIAALTMTTIALALSGCGPAPKTVAVKDLDNCPMAVAVDSRGQLPASYHCAKR